MTGTTFHSRAEVLRAVIDVADVRQDGALPMDVAGVAEKFEDELDLLGAFQLRWHTGLAGRIENVLMDHQVDPEAAVVLAWQQAAADMPGIRSVLDQHRQHPVNSAMATTMGKAVAKEHLMLAVMAGRGDAPDEVCVQIGAIIEERARCDEQVAPTPEAQRSRPLLHILDRLKAVIAA